MTGSAGVATPWLANEALRIARRLPWGQHRLREHWGLRWDANFNLPLVLFSLGFWPPALEGLSGW